MQTVCSRQLSAEFAGGGEPLDEFYIPSATGAGGLLFFQRLPLDLTEPIQSFWVRVTDQNLSAAIQVSGGYIPSHPAPLFAEMARRWAGWDGELTWESLEGELTIRCTHDCLGHIFIRVQLLSGHLPDDWFVKATISTEAGQLESIARHAELFFGRAA
jgi:hypothetical protein